MFGIDVDNHVDFCINGLEALETFKASTNAGFRYGLIFMDFSMPVMDGVIATQSIRKFIYHNKHLRDVLTIVGITGHVADKFKV